MKPAIALRMVICLLVFVASFAHAQKLAWTVSSDGSDVDADRLYRLNVETGEATLIGRVPDGNGDIEGLAQDAAGVLYGVDDIEKSLLRFNTSNGSAQAVGSLRLPTGLANNLDLSIAIDCTGQAFMVSAVNNRVYRVNLSSGQPEQLTSAATLPGGVTDLVVRDDVLLGLGEDRLYRIDKVSGIATAIGSGYGSNIRFTDGGGVGVDRDGGLWAVADRNPGRPSQIYRLNADTGVATLSGSTTVSGLESLSMGSPLCRGSAPPALAPIPVPAMDRAGILLLLLFAVTLGLIALPRAAR